MQQSVDVIVVDKWSAGYHKESDSAVLSFIFEDADEPLAFSMSRDLAGLIGQALLKLSEIDPPKHDKTA